MAMESPYTSWLVFAYVLDLVTLPGIPLASILVQ